MEEQTLKKQDTIVAVATAMMPSSVGIIRVSGPNAFSLAEKITKKKIIPRSIQYLNFYSAEDLILDKGIILSFQSPNSFTGEDVIELQGHGGPIILRQLIQTLCQFGARLARPGEFSERAFLNDKLDLVQAEAIDDLIKSTSEQAAFSAMNSLQGNFSTHIQQLVEHLIQCRLYIESAIDFSEEEIDFLSDKKIENRIRQWLVDMKELKEKASQGSLLREGITVVIAGKPNAGKSSILNALAGEERAIVTDIAGTTRDALKEVLTIDGLPIHIIDTAGLRETNDKVEQMGIHKAREAIKNANHILLVIDASLKGQNIKKEIEECLKITHKQQKSLTLVANKQDLDVAVLESIPDDLSVIKVSAKTLEGLDRLKEHLKDVAGYQASNENVFLARSRHLEAMALANQHVEQSLYQLVEYKAGELVAEELRLAQKALDEITGKFTSDDLLGRIFSSFCIGK